MRSHLHGITNWHELAEKAKYRAAALARACNCSLRELQRHFAAHMRCTPQEWLNQLRLQRALLLLQSNKSVKETAYELGLSPTQFARRYKRHHGVSPSATRRAAFSRRPAPIQPVPWTASTREQHGNGSCAGEPDFQI